MDNGSPTPRPPRWEESLGYRLFLALSPRLRGRVLSAPPPRLSPFEEVRIGRSRGRGTLAATWYPPPGPARGAVLLLPPWVPWGRGYFHRRGRIQALRRAGYAALALDLPGFGGSGAAAGFPDREIADALAWLRRRQPGAPVHLWGVSAGGYWAHAALSRGPGVWGAFFEDVSPHLLEWSWRTAPAGRPFYLFFRHALPGAYRYLDARLHAPHLRLHRVAYVGGAEDTGVLPTETRDLARRAGGDCLIVPGAPHLAAIKRAKGQLHDLALATFERAERSASGRRLEEAVLGSSVRRAGAPTAPPPALQSAQRE